MRWPRIVGAASVVAALVWSLSLTGSALPTALEGEGEAPIEITLGPKASKCKVDVEGREYRITLDRILDSRCPKDATCVWAGELSAQLEIERTDTTGTKSDITLGEVTTPTIEIMDARLDLVSIDETNVTFTIRGGD